ncbi:hypothetical protein LINGRAHAP2_LOCUS16978 [Linum grandiflorum]
MCQNLLKAWNYVFGFVRRKRNQLAHVLARRSEFHTSSFSGVIPPFCFDDKASYICRATDY